MRRPGALLHSDPGQWHYTKVLDPPLLLEQYDAFAEAVTASGAEIHWLPDDEDDLADSVFTYDPSFTVPGGAVLLRPGKGRRAGEVDLHRAFYEQLGIPILGAVEDPGTIEGGDCFWLDPTTVAVGRSFRTNHAGVEQFADILHPMGIEVAAFDLPHHRGPDACLHLMSLVSPLDTDLALVHLPLLPTALYQQMAHSGWTLLDAPVDEFEDSLGLNLNVLATAPRELIAIDGFPDTLDLMLSAGCSVTTFPGDELCIPCEGGPTCLTRPLLRG
jgi:N-dimethylarginine dimethylaminohydrolase